MGAGSPLKPSTCMLCRDAQNLQRFRFQAQLARESRGLVLARPMLMPLLMDTHMKLPDALSPRLFGHGHHHGGHEHRNDRDRVRSAN